MDSATWTSTHRGWPGYSHCWVPGVTAAEISTVSNVERFPWWLASYLVAGWLHWTTFILCCSYWNRHLFWIWICLPCMECFCQNYHSWTYRMPIHHQDIPQTSFFIKELISQQMKCGSEPILMGFTDITMYPTILKQDMEIYIFWLMLAWYIFFHSFTFNLHMNLYLNWVS